MLVIRWWWLYILKMFQSCWTYETSVCCGIELNDTIPYNKFYNDFGPNYSLSILPQKVRDYNSKRSVNKIIEKIFCHLNEIECSPSVQISNDVKISDSVSKKEMKNVMDIDEKKNESMEEYEKMIMDQVVDSNQGKDKTNTTNN